MKSFDLRVALGDWQGVLRENVVLAPSTHVRIGGPARWFCEPFTEDDVARVALVTRENALPLYVLGGGSNLLVADEGVDGVVLTLASLNRTVRDKNRITAWAGTSLPSLLRATKDVGLAGLETLVGIPAQVGGAVAMNAGTRDGATFDRLVEMRAVDHDAKIRTFARRELTPEYRNGNLGDRIALAATWELVPDSPQAIYSRLEESLRRRNMTQPVTQKSVGCVFRNPPGQAAGALIEQAGCKLMRKGNVSVSAKHANYFVNEGEGTAHDFLDLMAAVRQRVADRFGVQLQPEVKIWGV